MFSSSFLPKKVKIYRFTRDQYYSNFRDFIKTDNIMAQTFMNDEVTLYKFIGEDDEQFERFAENYDPRCYNVINIHEDVPGIDHIGIVHRITAFFVQYEIPLLYLNTYAYNLVLVSDEHIDQALQILKLISNVSPKAPMAPKAPMVSS